MRITYETIISLPQIKKKFLNKINITNECWVWPKAAYNGYGFMALTISKNKTYTISAHKLSYLLFIGNIKDDLLIRHTCNNRLCVNPDHLLLGTKQDNTNDMLACDRQPSKLKSVDVLKIIPRIIAGESYISIAKDFGVSISTISSIKTGNSWTHLSGGPITIENVKSIFSFVERIAYNQGYRVDCYGTVYNRNGRVLKPSKTKDYISHNIVISGKFKTVKAHRLHAYQLFGDNIYQPGIVVRHLNGNSRDNSINNLALGTVQENILDKSVIERHLHSKRSYQNRKNK